MLKVVIIEDNDIIRNGLQVLLNKTESFQCLAAFSHFEDMLDEVDSLKCDIILIDINLPGISGIEGIKKLKSLDYNALILILTVYGENERIFDALRAGACGYILKNTPPERMPEILNDAFNGEVSMSSQIALEVINHFKLNKPQQSNGSSAHFSKNETGVLKGLVDGNSIKAIADSRGTNVKNVRTIIFNIYKKLHQETMLIKK